MNWKRILAPVAAAALCVGCFDLTEEIWIEADGSGRIRLDVAIESETFEMISAMGGEENPFDLDAKNAELASQIASNPNFTDGKIELYEEGGAHHMVWEVEVADITQLSPDDLRRLTDDGSGEGGGDDIGGEFSITRTADGFRFQQQMEDASAEMEDADAAAMQAMAAQMFGGHYFTIRVHGPGFESHNGTSSADDYVEWRFPFADLMTGNIELFDLEAVISAASGGGGGEAGGSSAGSGGKSRSGSLLYIIIGASVLLVIGAGMILFGRSQG